MNNNLISRNALIQHAYSAVVDGVEKDIIDLSDVDDAPTVEAFTEEDMKRTIKENFDIGYEMAKNKCENCDLYFKAMTKKEGEIIKAYTKGFDAGVETVKNERPQGNLISREALKEEMQKADIKANDYETLAKMYENCVDNAPIVSFMISPDYVTELQNLNKKLTKQLEETERPQGEWIHLQAIGDYKCSVCGCENLYKYANEHERWVKTNSNFCPNCGSEMRKGGAE